MTQTNSEDAPFEEAAHLRTTSECTPSSMLAIWLSGTLAELERTSENGGFEKSRSYFYTCPVMKIALLMMKT